VIDSIEAIRNGLRAGRFANEAAISQGIVLRILSELSWPAYDTTVVWPEYALQGRRVDFALCHPPGKPIVFIEVKQVGQGTDAERQLFEYAFHLGVPLAILTTGQEWQFFLPAERGDYGERRVYKLDLLVRASGTEQRG
jgi:predicted type IV restriction endonuclease